MLDVGFGEILILAAAALFIFGPDKLPKLAADAARTFRTLRQMVTNARRDLTDTLGPEFDGMNLEDLNPRTFVRSSSSTHGYLATRSPRTTAAPQRSACC